MSQMKFIGDPETAVHDAFCGMQYAYPSLSVDPHNRIVISNKIVKNQVCVLSGGGSGHEPFAAGFVGEGMATGAVAGYVFASPPVHAIYNAIRTLADNNNNAGIMMIILNYTGDVLNFGLAAEKAKTHNIKVELLAVDDDCSRLSDEIQGAGRRGMCGTCLVIKLAGAMAADGKSLKEISAECHLANDAIATFANALTSCSIPGSGPLFEIKPDEIDIGLGIHGEAGISRTKLKPIKEIVEIMTAHLIKALNLKPGFELCVMLSNTGAVSQLEMAGICAFISSHLKSKDFQVLRFYNGSYLTSLDMAGFQYCIFNLTGHLSWLRYLDDRTEAPGWNATLVSVPVADCNDLITIEDVEDELATNETGPTFNKEEAAIFKKCLLTIAKRLIEYEKHLNELDTLTGDGDCGSTLRRFGDSIVKNISQMELQHPARCFYRLSKLSQNSMGGTSGALYGILLASASNSLFSMTSVDWAAVWKTSIETLRMYSTANIGDRTMVDSLLPACEEFNARVSRNEGVVEAFTAAVKIAEEKCEETKTMTARLGKASYVPSEYIRDVDPGAFAVTVWLNAILYSIRS